MRKIVITLILLSMTIYVINAQNFDILIKDGHLIDPKNNINGIMDIAILNDKIAMINNSIPESEAKKVINAKGLIISPGLLDIHGHVFFGTKPNSYLSNSFSSLPPDGFTLRSGVTTIVDVGGAGWKNFKIFKEQTIDRSKTRVLSFLNIVGSGMKGSSYEQNIEDMDPESTANLAKQFPKIIVGVKLAHFSGPNWEPLNRTVEAGILGNIPVMIDFGGSTPELSMQTLLMEKLRSGDIFTHAYANVKGRTPLVNKDGIVRSYVFEAKKKGIIFDVGHGGGSFVFEQAIPAMEQGFWPNSISTDLHTGSMNGGMKNLTNIMSKFLNMNMPIYDVIKSVTWSPAQYINRTDLGHLSTGAVADIALLKIISGDFGFVDTKKFKMLGTKKIVCDLTIRAGEIVWDLNGISSPLWKE